MEIDMGTGAGVQRARGPRRNPSHQETLPAVVVVSRLADVSVWILKQL